MLTYLAVEVFYIAPSELRRRFTLDDITKVSAYYKLKKEFKDQAPPPPDDEHPLLLAVMANPEAYGFTPQQGLRRVTAQ